MTIKEKYEKSIEDLEAGRIDKETAMLIEAEYYTWIKGKKNSQVLNG